MSFRARLRLFFVLIVIVPMLSVALVLFRLISDNETGKTDSDIHARQHAAIQLYGDARGAAERAVEGVGNDRVLARLLPTDNTARARRGPRRLIKTSGPERFAPSRGGEPLLDAGDRAAIAPAR